MNATPSPSGPRLLTENEIDTICGEALDEMGLDGRRVLFLIPDGTRSCPVDILFRTLYRHLAGRLPSLDFMIALGTHRPLDREEIYRRVGISEEEHAEQFPKARFFNHCWNDPDHLTSLGTIPADEIRRLTGDRFEIAVEITVNKAVREYDDLVIVGPVFPHEVIGFSGGNKYIFPGISGPELLNFFHWLGAVVTSPCTLGVKDTAVRRVVNYAAARVPARRHAFCMVVAGGGLAGLFAGTPEEAWSEAADLSARTHVVTVPRPYPTVLSCAPPMYEDLWVAGKCMYKLEPVVADGGRLIIYAPHLREISATHGDTIRRIGYHTRDYFLHHWETYRDEPWGILAHSTHVRGIGTMEDGVERPRIDVILATGLPEDTCREIGLGYMDPDTVDPAAYRNREEEGILCVAKAGEILYRLEGSLPGPGGGEASG